MENQATKKARAKQTFAASMRCEGNSVKDALNQITGAWAGMQRRRDEIERVNGRPLTTDEEYLLTNCRRCGDNNDCTCDE